MKKLIIVILSIILVLSIIITIFLVKLKKSQELSQEDMAKITSNYQLVSDKVNEYNKIRVTLNEYMDNFYFDTYLENENNYLVTLNSYDQAMKDIQGYIQVIDEKCIVIYKDSSVNSICQTYQTLYEKLVNLYVSDITNYNSKIISYNDYKNSDIELYPMLYTEYLDYNKDKTKEGQVK